VTGTSNEKPKDSGEEIFQKIEDQEQERLKALNEGFITNMTKSQEYFEKFLMLTLSILSEVNKTSNREFKLNYSRVLYETFYKNVSNLNTYPDEFLAQLGILKVRFSSFFGY